MLNLILLLVSWQPDELITFPSELEADTFIVLERIAWIETEQEKLIWLNEQATDTSNFRCTYNAMNFNDFKLWKLESGYTTWIMVSCSYARWNYFKSILSLKCD